MDSCLQPASPVFTVLVVLLTTPIIIALWGMFIVGVWEGTRVTLRDWKLDRIRKAKERAEAAL